MEVQSAQINLKAIFEVKIYIKQTEILRLQSILTGAINICFYVIKKNYSSFYRAYKQTYLE